MLSRSQGDYTSPRHRHNFDQIRVCLEGRANIAPGKDLMAGDVGYFPEGTCYGPQEDPPATRVTLVLQFGGASGLGYMSSAQLRAGQEALEARGSFSGGRYRAQEGGEPRDSYEAIWEHAMGRPMRYPAPRYDAPLLIRPAAFAWVATGGGASRKPLGSFTERGTRIESVRLDPGAAARIGETEALTLGFVLSGSGEADGIPWRRNAGLRLAPGETAALTATEPAEIVTIVLPPVTAAG